MARTNVRSAISGVFVSFLFLCGCEATTLPAPRYIWVEKAQVARPAMNLVKDAASPTESVAPAACPLAKSHAAPMDEPLRASEEPPAAPAPATRATVVVVHRAELRGTVGVQVGQRLKIEPLVATSSTLPAAGSKADLWVESSIQGEPGWALFAEVKVESDVRFGEPVDVEIIDEDGGLGAEGTPMSALPPGSRVRLEWEW